jgi:S-DNA-T family DNA segregation ATPase FtsK/SpoIIIE
MTKRVRIILDISAVALILAAVAAAAAMTSHLALSAASDATTPSNLLGGVGAGIAPILISFFGLAGYVFLAALCVLGLTLLLEGRHGGWCWRLLGWFLLVPSVALGLDLVNIGNLVGLPAGQGGTLGRSLHGVLSVELWPVGVYLVAAALVAAAIGFAVDFAWPGALRLFGIGVHFISTKLADRRARRRLRAAGVQPMTGLPTANLGSIPVHHPDPLTTAAPAQAEKAPPAVHRPAPLPEWLPANDFQLPPYDLLEDPEPFPYDVHDQHLRDRAVKLEKTFTDFGLNVRVVGINTGPVITQYEVALETGLRLHKVTRLADDVALNLKVPSVRMVAPIPGKDTVGVEIPNEHRAVVRLKEVILNAGPKLAKCKLPLFLGKDAEGRPLIYDLAEMPHLLIAGRTGTGKSVCMNAMILSMLMTRRPDEVKMILIDPKMLELSEYGKIPHLMHPVVKDMKKAEAILAWAVDKMEERYDLLSRARVRSVAGYNELAPDEIYRRVRPVDDDERARIPERMPYIVLFVDEMNDLMMTMRKEVEGHIIRLAQKSRAAGIHLVVATQKPTVDVITGLIKSNLPARICFQVSCRTDSRVVLDEMGAEKLLGRGDMLFLQPGTSTIIRAQGTYASDGEISRVVEHLECEPAYARELIQLSTSAKDGKSGLDALRDRDEMYEPAIEVIVREGRGSVSLLQRALGIGYGRAARLIDFMAEDAIVGPYNGSNAREVLLTPEQWQQMKQQRELQGVP